MKLSRWEKTLVVMLLSLGEMIIEGLCTGSHLLTNLIYKLFFLRTFLLHNKQFHFIGLSTTDKKLAHQANYWPLTYPLVPFSGQVLSFDVTNYRFFRIDV